MKPLIIILVAVIASMAVPRGSSSAPSEKNALLDTTATRDLSEAEASKVLDFVFRGRPNRALGFLDSLETRSGQEPLFLLMRARCHQEFVPMDDVNKNTGREISRASLDDLDRCIAVCTRRIDSGAADTKLYFYRGWAWTAKAYVRSMTRDLYAAGKEAKKGKKDLERYLEIHPGDPTATGLLGAFLYFADTIPGAFKLISRILLLPTGDREKGLECLETAARSHGLLETDWKLILYNVYFYFEGRFEEGLAGLQTMIELYPEYARTAIPLAVSRPFAPRLAMRNDELVETTINSIYRAPNREVDWNALYLVQLFRAYGDRYCNHSRTTLSRLRSIIHESPRHPDWVEGWARLELGRLYASQGRRDEAVAMLQSVARGHSFDYLRKEANKLLEDIGRFDSSFDGPPPPNMDQWVTALYRAASDSLPAIRSRFAELAPQSVAAVFYTGECDLLSGDFTRALKSFEGVISVDAPAWDHPYQMIASTRIAEIYAARRFYKTAARYEGIAMSYYHSEYLVDWVMEGRKRYFERLGEGKETGPPTLLSACTPAERAAPRGAPRADTTARND